MQPLAVQTPTLLAGDAAMAWRGRRSVVEPPPRRPDVQNVLARLDAAIDRLEGAYERLDELKPLLEQYAASLRSRQSGRR